MRVAKGCGFSSAARRQIVEFHANQPRVLDTMLKLLDRVRM
jgi:hypothetical protein